MRERQPGDRLRVVVAGNIYAKRTLVRRFLEDDGFDVVAEPFSREELLALGAIATTDAVVVDGDLVVGGIEPLRSAAPDAKIVVFTGRTAGVASPAGADGYLEKGTGLASLTALLHALLAESPAPPLGVAWPEPAPASTARPTERRVLAGFAGIAAGVVLVAVVTLAVFGGAGTVPIANPITSPSSSPAPPRPGKTSLDLATRDLKDLRTALAAGRTTAARSALRDLAAILGAAHPTFATGSFIVSAANSLQGLIGDVSGALLRQMRAVFGDTLRLPASGPVSGGSSILTSSAAATGATTSGTRGPSSGGATGATAGSHTGSRRNGGGSTAGGSTAGGPTGSAGQGQGGSSGGRGNRPDTARAGHHYGWVNKPPSGGWHGTKPHANGGAAGHGRGRGRGHRDG